ncbi:MAG: hypothetical protein K0S33_22 [Bacteroidetes bacterium]|jgi:hypothetical protein|nr:hypothetical protein [Bacteroidota bacterium]
MKKETKKTLLWIVLFATAMGFLETSVVVYLRELYYPEGFNFPLTTIPNKIAVVEFWREFATIIMLVGAGIIAGKTKLSRFAYFIIAFAVWDLFYYVFLYVLIQWPQSLFTWDILFLIPFPWTGPVIAPCLVALGMTLLGYLIIHYEEKNGSVRIITKQWSLLIGGVCIIIFSFMWDYFSITYETSVGTWTLLSKNNMFEEIKTYVPVQFNWPLFFAGLSCSAAGMLSCYLSWRTRPALITNQVSENN